MGAVAATCSDVNKQPDKGSITQLDKVDSEEEEEDEEEEEEEEGADDAAKGGRNRKSTFREVIDNTAAQGIDEEKILHAEEMLAQHKAMRRRQAFENGLQDFIDSEEGNILDNCEQKERDGLGMGVGDEVLQPLRDKIALLQLCRDLEADEIEQAKQFMESAYRHFLTSCLRGRDLMWVDTNSGKKKKATANLDVTLKNFKILDGNGGLISTCKVKDVVAKRARDSEDMCDSDAFTSLSKGDQNNAVAVIGPDEPWLLVESGPTKLDEFIIAFIVYNGVGLSDKASSPKKKGKGKKPKDEEEEEEAEESTPAKKGKKEKGKKKKKQEEEEEESE